MTLRGRLNIVGLSTYQNRNKAMTNSSLLATQALLIVFIVMLIIVLFERFIDRARKQRYIRYEFCGIKCSHDVEDIEHAQRIANCLDLNAMSNIRVVSGLGVVTHALNNNGHIVKVEV